MILIDRQIKRNWTIDGNDKVSPASVDLATQLKEEITIAPGASVLLSTASPVDFSDGMHAALLVLRTSSFRKGLALASPGWVDPGYYGTLTFRVTNVVDEPITVRPGDRLIQIIIFAMPIEPDQLYAGRYQGSSGAVGYRE